MLYRPRTNTRAKWVVTKQKVVPSGIWKQNVTDAALVGESAKASVPFKASASVAVVTVDVANGKILFPVKPKKAALAGLPEFKEESDLGERLGTEYAVALLYGADRDDLRRFDQVRAVIRDGSVFVEREIDVAAIPDGADLPTFEDMEHFKADYNVNTKPLDGDPADFFFYRGIWILREEAAPEDAEDYYQSNIEDITFENPDSNLAKGLFYCIPTGTTMERLTNVDDFSNSYLTPDQRDTYFDLFSLIDRDEVVKFLVMKTGHPAVYLTADNIVEEQENVKSISNGPVRRGQKKNLLTRSVPGLKAWTFRQLLFWILDVPELHEQVAKAFVTATSLGKPFLKGQTLDTLIMYWDGSKFGLTFPHRVFEAESQWRRDVYDQRREMPLASLLNSKFLLPYMGLIKIGKSEEAVTWISQDAWTQVVNTAITDNTDKRTVNADSKLGSGTNGSVFSVNKDKALKMSVVKDLDNIRVDRLKAEVATARLFSNVGIGPQVFSQGTIVYERRCIGYIYMKRMQSRIIDLLEATVQPDTWADQVFNLLGKVSQRNVFCFDLHLGNCMANSQNGIITEVRLIDFGLCDDTTGVDDSVDPNKQKGQLVLRRVKQKYSDVKQRPKVCLAIMVVQFLSYLQIEEYNEHFSPGVAILLKRLRDLLATNPPLADNLKSMLQLGAEFPGNVFLTGLTKGRTPHGKYGSRINMDEPTYLQEILMNTQTYVDINLGVERHVPQADDFTLGTYKPARVVPKLVIDGVVAAAVAGAAESAVDLGDGKLGTQMSIGKTATVFEIGANQAIKIGLLEYNMEVAYWKKECELAKFFGELDVGPAVYSCGIESKCGYILMEKMEMLLIPGINRRKVPDWNEQIVNILDIISANNYIMPDIHLSNWMVLRDQVRMIDFGVSVKITPNQRNPEISMIMGESVETKYVGAALRIINLAIFVCQLDVNFKWPNYRNQTSQLVAVLAKAISDLAAESPETIQCVKRVLQNSNFLVHGVVNKRKPLDELEGEELRLYGKRTQYKTVGEFVETIFNPEEMEKIIEFLRQK